MPYQINLGQWNKIFAVPASVVDKHIKLASEAQLKVLLFLLRHAGENIEENEISSALNISPEEIINALDFWREREVLAKSDNAYTPSAVSDAPVSADVDKPAVTELPKKPHTTPSRAQRPDPAFVSKLLKEDKYLASLLEEAQNILKKPLSPGDTATLVMLYDTFGLPCEVIAMLMVYLSSNGSANMRAVEKIGLKWADNAVKTIADAEREIERMTASKEAWGRVSYLFGIKNIGNPTSSQLEHADRWINTWGFNDEMLTEAYERCVNTKGEYSIRYIDGILRRWYEKNIKSIDTLKAEEAAAKSKKKPAAKNMGSMFSLEGASFDVSKYENNSLFDD